VATGIQVAAHLNSGVRTVETMNVVGLLRGSERPDEVITVTSHYDHLGIGQAVDGDSIYNGAYDNASGSSLLLNVAQGFSALPTAPARSILFMAAAAEEQGLLGAAWYVQTPLFPLAQTVAEINVDGANLWGESADMTVFGVDRNELGAIVRARAGEMDITLVPDQEPEKGFFFRSDHFPFARAGVPSLYIEHGYDFRNRDDGEEIRTHYQEVQYHQPADEFSAEYVYDGAVQQATFLFLIAYDIAQDDGWPNWLPGSEFKAARDAQRR
jgi:Zn-dependent M28 family amino/carboxypeptidase